MKRTNTSNTNKPSTSSSTVRKSSSSVVGRQSTTPAPSSSNNKKSGGALTNSSSQVLPGPRKSKSDLLVLNQHNNNKNNSKEADPNSMTQHLHSDRDSWLKLAINNDNNDSDNNNSLQQNNSESDDGGKLLLRLGAVILYQDQLWRVRYLGPVKFSSSSSSSASSTTTTRNSTEDKVVSPVVSAAIRKYLQLNSTTTAKNDENVSVQQQKLINMASGGSLYLGLELLQPRDENPIDRQSIFPPNEYSSSSSLSSPNLIVSISKTKNNNNNNNKSPILVGTSSFNRIEYFSCHNEAFVVMAPFQEIFANSSNPIESMPTMMHNVDDENNVRNDDDNENQHNNDDDVVDAAPAVSGEYTAYSRDSTTNQLFTNNNNNQTTSGTSGGLVTRLRKEFSSGCVSAEPLDQNQINQDSSSSENYQQHNQNNNNNNNNQKPPVSPLLSFQQQRRLSSPPSALSSSPSGITVPAHAHARSTSTPLSTLVTARQGVQRLVDLMERKATHEEELLKDVLDNVLKPPKNVEALHRQQEQDKEQQEKQENQEQTTSSPSFLQQIERAISLAASVQTSSNNNNNNNNTSTRLAHWTKKIINLESNVINNADDFRAKIAEVPDTLLEISRRLSFDAEDLIRSKEEAAREHGDVEALQNGAKAAVRCLATACDILAGECDPESSKLFVFQRDFLKTIIDDATSSLNELRFDRESLAGKCFDTVSAISTARQKASGSAEKSISDFALLQYKLKSRLTEEKKCYDDAVHEEKDAMRLALEALDNLERAGRRREDAADKLRKACVVLNEEKDVFADSLATHRTEEKQHSEEEQVASALLEAVNVPCESLFSDAERVTKEAENDIKALVRSSWMKLHQEHAEVHRYLMKSAGDLFFRHRASIQNSSNENNKNNNKNRNEEMTLIEHEVQKADDTFRRVSLEALQIAGIDWVDPQDEIKLQLEERARTVVQGIASQNIQKREEEETKQLLLMDK